MNRIREFRRMRGWTLQKLADASGTTKSQIDKLEKGFRRLTVDWMVRLAKPLNCDPRDLMIMLPNGPPFESVRHGEVRGTGKHGTIPIRGTRGGSVVPKPLNHVPRTYFLAQAKDAYAMYVAGEVMAPMYRPRQLLFINPHKLAVPGAGVVVIDKKGGVSIREFVRQDPGNVIVREHQPRRRDVTLRLSEIDSMHAVAGLVEV